jgi:hypothetical protein
MLFKECPWLDDDQSFAPIEEPGQQDHEGARGSGRTSRPHPAFFKQSELFAKEQVLGSDCCVGGKEQPDEREQLHILQEIPSFPTKIESNYCGAQVPREYSRGRLSSSNWRVR